MAVTTGAVTTASRSAGTASLTFSFVSNGSPLYLVVPIWMSTNTLNTVTFNLVGLTRVAQSALSNSNDRAEIWRLLAPATTTANIVLSFSGNNPSGTVGAFQTSGQDTVTPEGAAATSAGTAAGITTGNLSVGPAANDLTIVGISGGGALAITPASSGGGAPVELFDIGGAPGEEGECFTVADAATVVSGTFASQTWAIAAIPLKALATPFIFQQNALWPHRAM